MTLTKISGKYFIEENPDLRLYRIMLEVSESENWLIPLGLAYQDFQTAKDVILSGKVKYL